MNYFLTFKALHIIFIVTWFSALFFLGRILIYHSEALNKKEENAVLFPLLIKAERNIIWIILVPSICLAAIAGLTMMMITKAYLFGWFHIKLALIVLFIAYNFYLLRLRRRIRLEQPHPKGVKLRLLNEVPFLFLVAIVFTVYQKSFFSGLWAVAFIVGILSFIGFIFRIKQQRKAGLVKKQ